VGAITATEAAFFPWTGGIDFQRAIGERLAVEHLDGFFRLTLVAHLDESEAL
jgi:hypothetical protein